MFLFSFLSILIFVSNFIHPVFAVSNSFFPKAQVYYQQRCTKKILSNEASLFCYLFDKANEIDNNLISINRRIYSVENNITDLQNQNLTQKLSIESLEKRLKEVESKLSTPETKIVYFAENRPQPFDSDWIDASGYTLLKINLSISDFITQYDVHYSNDKITYINQATVNCFNSSVCSESTFGIQGKYYRISTGTASGNITATGLLYN